MSKHEIKIPDNTATEVTLTKKEQEAFTRFDKRINEAIASTDSNMLKIAGALAAIEKGKLARVVGYKTTAEYAANTFGISKSSVSEAINMWKKFGNSDTGNILPEYSGFSYTQLKLMRKLPDELLAQVTPETSSRQIQEMINSTKELPEQDTAEETTEVAEVAETTTPEPTHTENSGEVAPYVQFRYTLETLETIDPNQLKAMILDAFEKESDIHFIYVS